MRRAWAVAVVLALGGLAGPARGQSVSGQLFAIGGGGQVVSQSSIPIRIEGELVVAFHGDAAAGCAAYGLCAYAGTVVVRPVSGDLTILTVRHGKRLGHQALLLVGNQETGYSTSARVERSVSGGPPGTCADAQSSVFGANTAAVTHGNSLTIRLLARGGSLLQTRCAGPLDGDLAGDSPAATISLARALRGGAALRLSGTRTFAAHGFAGTMTSSIVLRLGKPQRQSGSGFPPGIKTQRVRTVTERLSLVRVDGGLSAAVSGTADPVVCALLDTCGLTGTLTLEPAGRLFNATVIATGPASRPYRDFETAMGLARGGRTRGIQVFGTIGLTGAVGAQISQAGVTCDDTGGNGAVATAFGSLGALAGVGGLVGPWRTRCPGPSLQEALAGLSTSVQPAALRHREFTVDLRARGSLTDDGYVITPQGEISLVLRRGRVTSQVSTQPTP